MNLITKTYILTIPKNKYLEVINNPSLSTLSVKSAIGGYKHLMIVSNGKIYHNEVDLKQNEHFVIPDDEELSEIRDRIADYIMDNEDNESLKLFMKNLNETEIKTLLDNFYDTSIAPTVGTVNKIKESIVSYFANYSSNDLLYEYEKYFADRFAA